MAEYRKKPVVIEAFKWGTDERPQWFLDAYGDKVAYLRDDELYIDTLEGEHHVSDGDYIIKGVQGELYPCKPRYLRGDV